MYGVVILYRYLLKERTIETQQMVSYPIYILYLYRYKMILFSVLDISYLFEISHTWIAGVKVVIWSSKGEGVLRYTHNDPVFKVSGPLCILKCIYRRGGKRL